MFRYATLLLVIFAASVAVACSGENDDGEDPGLRIERLEVIVGESALNPMEVHLRVPDRYQLIVENQSTEDCTFSLAGYVLDLDVPAGATAEADVQLPANVPPDGDERSMGCDGQPMRTGRVQILNSTGTDLGN